MNTTTKLALKPDFTFNPSDFVQVGGEGAMQLRPSQGGPAQGSLDLQPPAPKQPPWATASAEQKTVLNWRHSHEAHAKMDWITENVPGHKSLQKLMDKALLPYIEALIEQHYKPET